MLLYQDDNVTLLLLLTLWLTRRTKACMMTLIVIGLDTTQLCTELIVCDWNCQDFFCVASVARPL